jgi:hypothetical protein
MKARPMTNSHSSTFLNPRSSADSAARADRELNAAIVSADISASYEGFLAIVDQFYADDVELRSDSSPEPLIGRDRLKSRLFGFLVPLHVMAEIGGLSVSVSERPIAGDSVAAWMRDADLDGRVVRFLDPPLTPAERAIAEIEGWVAPSSGIVITASAPAGLS